jgi:ABC-type oligopeptide transport system ATPase subunit
MQQGLIVDQGSEDQVLINPRLITKNMIAAVPVPDIEKRERCLIAGWK